MYAPQMPNTTSPNRDVRETTVRQSFETDPYAAALGFRLSGLDDATVAVSVDVRDDHVNFHGTTHGGLVFSLADCAFSLASNAHGDVAVAIDTHLAITAGSKIGDTLTATAVEMTRGRRLGTYRVDVVRGDGTVVALFTGTVFIK